MPRFLAAAAALAVLFATACGSDDGGESNPGDDATSPASSTAPTATDAQIAVLARVQVPGYSVSEPGGTLLGAAVTHTATKKTAGGAELTVRVSLAPCDDFVCAGLDATEYETPAAQDNLKSVLPTTHKENPALHWEFGEVALSPSATGLYYYAVSYVESTAAGGVSRSSANSYRAWYHDGGTYVTLEVSARSPASPLSQADVEKAMTKAEAEQAAKDVFAALEPKFPK